MSRSVRLAGYCMIVFLTLLPMLIQAQKKSLNTLKRELDSMSIGQSPEKVIATADTAVTEDNILDYKHVEGDGDDDGEETEIDPDTTTRTTAPPKTHYLWDQDVPVSSDSVNEYDYDGYEGGRLVLRKVPAALIKELNADKKLQYDKIEEAKRKKEEEAQKKMGYLQLFIAGIFALLNQYRWIFVIVIAVALVVLLLFVLKGNGFSFSFGKRKKEDVVALTDEELDLDTYELQIKEAIKDGKFRLAVRLLYLQSLRLLADKNIISFSKEKTNAEYLRAMRSTAWYKAFANLTLDYEYIWYGEVPVNETQFNLIHRHFSQFMNELGYTR